MRLNEKERGNPKKKKKNRKRWEERRWRRGGRGGDREMWVFYNSEQDQRQTWLR